MLKVFQTLRWQQVRGNDQPSRGVANGAARLEVLRNLLLVRLFGHPYAPKPKK